MSSENDDKNEISVAKISAKVVMASAFLGGLTSLLVAVLTSGADLLKLPLSQQQTKKYELENELMLMELNERKADYFAKLISNISIKSGDVEYVIDGEHRYIKRNIYLKNKGSYPLEIKYTRFDLTDDSGKSFEYEDYQGSTQKPSLYSSTLSLGLVSSLPSNVEISFPVVVEVNKLPCDTTKYIWLNISTKSKPNEFILDHLVTDDSSPLETETRFSTVYEWRGNDCES